MPKQTTNLNLYKTDTQTDGKICWDFDRDLNNNWDTIDTVIKSLLDRISILESHIYLLDAWKDGTSWYRVYSDGWCEQGGQCNITQDAATLVTTHLPFGSNNYQVLITVNRATTQTGGDGNYSYNIVSDSTFNWRNGDDFTGIGVWEAKGHIDLSSFISKNT